MNEIQQFRKKITPYLDGTLSLQERSEFEAFVSTHPDLQKEVLSKTSELTELKALMPSPELSRDSAESLESEIKLSVFNLLREEPRNLWEQFKTALEEWLNR